MSAVFTVTGAILHSQHDHNHDGLPNLSGFSNQDIGSIAVLSFVSETMISPRCSFLSLPFLIPFVNMQKQIWALLPLGKYGRNINLWKCQKCGNLRRPDSGKFGFMRPGITRAEGGREGYNFHLTLISNHHHHHHHHLWGLESWGRGSKGRKYLALISYRPHQINWTGNHSKF